MSSDKVSVVEGMAQAIAGGIAGGLRKSIELARNRFDVTDKRITDLQAQLDAVLERLSKVEATLEIDDVGCELNAELRVERGRIDAALKRLDALEPLVAKINRWTIDENADERIAALEKRLSLMPDPRPRPLVRDANIGEVQP
jgi:uncharacterized coiled-coil protein SlyX